MSLIDTYRDAFLAFLKQGMTHAEAMEQFDRKEWSAAVMEELDAGLVKRCPSGFATDEGLPSLMSLGALADMQQRSTDDFERQALPLMLAGWTSEVPNPTNSKDPWRQCQTMSLYWRAPSKRAGKPGRRYLSTNQAYRAMMRMESVVR